MAGIRGQGQPLMLPFPHFIHLDRNTERLSVETERLAEHTKRACRCWIWFIVLVVSITFVGKSNYKLQVLKFLTSTVQADTSGLGLLWRVGEYQSICILYHILDTSLKLSILPYLPDTGSMYLVSCLRYILKVSSPTLLLWHYC